MAPRENEFDIPALILPACSLPCPGYSPEAVLEAPGHVIPEKVGAEGRDQQVHGFHNLRGVSVFFYGAVKVEGYSHTYLRNTSFDKNTSDTLSHRTIYNLFLERLTSSAKDENICSHVGKGVHYVTLHNALRNRLKALRKRAGHSKPALVPLNDSDTLFVE